MLSSAPPGSTGRRSAKPATRAAANLQDAAAAFLPILVPSEVHVPHGMLKILLSLKQQQYIAECESSPGHRPDPDEFWSTPFERYAGSRRTRRGASATYFKVMANTAKDLVLESQGDLAKLRGEWNWDKAVIEVVAFMNGSAPSVLQALAESQERSSDGESLVEEMEEEDGEEEDLQDVSVQSEVDSDEERVLVKDEDSAHGGEPEEAEDEEDEEDHTLDEDDEGSVSAPTAQIELARTKLNWRHPSPAARAGSPRALLAPAQVLASSPASSRGRGRGRGSRRALHRRVSAIILRHHFPAAN